VAEALVDGQTSNGLCTDLVVAEPCPDVIDSILVEALIETPREIADMGSGKQVFSASVGVVR
jgi:hypothetical protein